MDYQDNILENIREKSYLLKICTATVLIRSTNEIILIEIIFKVFHYLGLFKYEITLFWWIFIFEQPLSFKDYYYVENQTDRNLYFSIYVW